MYKRERTKANEILGSLKASHDIFKGKSHYDTSGWERGDEGG